LAAIGGVFFTPSWSVLYRSGELPDRQTQKEEEQKLRKNIAKEINPRQEHVEAPIAKSYLVTADPGRRGGVNGNSLVLLTRELIACTFQSCHPGHSCGIGLRGSAHRRTLAVAKLHDFGRPSLRVQANVHIMIMILA
jgi:hypothetical protein